MGLQTYIPELPEGTNLEGKTVLLTGGTSGIGFEAARQFLTFKVPRIIITARNASKGQSSVQALRANPGVARNNPTAIIDVFELDLDDYKSVVKFCDQVKREASELDILVCNAGMNQMAFTMSVSGHEQVMQGLGLCSNMLPVNH